MKISFGLVFRSLLWQIAVVIIAFALGSVIPAVIGFPLVVYAVAASHAKDHNFPVQAVFWRLLLVHVLIGAVVFGLFFMMLISLVDGLFG